MTCNINSIICPQCGSSEIHMDSDLFGTCKTCGTQFSIQQEKQQEIHIHIHDDASEPKVKRTYCKAEVVPEYTTEQFLRKVWIEIGKDEAPPAVFEKDFDKVEQIKHVVVLQKMSADVAYQASIGYDREEPYIDYETYYEEEPYITTEWYWDEVEKTKRQRSVTKYRQVERQRQITKYKTVTDWSHYAGKLSDESTAIAENSESVYLDKSLFASSFTGAKEGSIIRAYDDSAKELEVTKTADDKLNEQHCQNFWNTALVELPGDQCRDVESEIENLKSVETTFVIAVEYVATLVCNGKTYKKYAYPFGSMEIGGDKFNNHLNLEVITTAIKEKSEKTIQKLEKLIEDRIANTEPNIWSKTKNITLITMGLCVTSIILSVLVRSLLLISLVFCFSIGAFVYSFIYERIVTRQEWTKVREEKEKTKDEIECERQRCKQEVENYEKNYKSKRRELLDKKLESLGFEPASVDEL